MSLTHSPTLSDVWFSRSPFWLMGDPSGADVGRLSPMTGDCGVDLRRSLAPDLHVLVHAARHRMCQAFSPVLNGRGDRNSNHSMAARTGEVGYERLHHCIGAGRWDSGPLEATLWEQADALVGGDKAWLIIDDTALPKKGTASVGVAPQYASALGKNANCQTLVSVTLASRAVPIMLGLRLFLPESWTSDEASKIGRESCRERVCQGG